MLDCKTSRRRVVANAAALKYFSWSWGLNASAFLFFLILRLLKVWPWMFVMWNHSSMSNANESGTGCKSSHFPFIPFIITNFPLAVEMFTVLMNRDRNWDIGLIPILRLLISVPENSWKLGFKIVGSRDRLSNYRISLKSQLAGKKFQFSRLQIEDDLYSRATSRCWIFSYD